MLSHNGNSLVLPAQFIQAIRDAGYKSLGSALAELVDNAFEARADNVSVVFRCTENSMDSELIIVIADNGMGMDTLTLGHSLQFGWSSRFNGRNSVGRYGMGLPNASLSYARRVEVWTSADGEHAHCAHLDVDEIVSGKFQGIPPVALIPFSEFRKLCPYEKGTAVVLKQCDRLKSRRIDILSRKLRSELGCMFRYQLWSGRVITIGGENVLPIDPLFNRKGANILGAKDFGPELSYEIELPERRGHTSPVKVRFTELPIHLWHSMSNEQKNHHGIAKQAGVSVVRAGREIDRGWFFMGQKRRENYDDWWRCEIRFEPDLDEMFGVTHTKQEIHPTEQLSSILTPDIERIARELNARVRKAFIVVKTAGHTQRESERFATRFDNLIEPPPQAIKSIKTSAPRRIGRRGRVDGLEYRLQMEKLDELAFFVPILEGNRLTVVLNAQHPFVRCACEIASATGNGISDAKQRNLELIILAASRAEVLLARDKKAQICIKDFRKSWSNILATFLS